MSTALASPITPIFAGQRCVGFLFNRGHGGWEAFDERQSLGLYENQDKAIAALAAQVAAPEFVE